MQDNPFSWQKREKKKTPVAPHHCDPDTLIFLGSRWEFGIIEFREARRTSYPAHFTVSSQTDVISPILWMNGGATDAGALHLTYVYSAEARRRYPEGY